MGKFLFFIPVIAIIVIVVVGLISITPSQAGTLVVQAMTSNRYSQSFALHVSATVGTSTETTPFNVTLVQGEYTVTYGPVEGYHTPMSRSVFLTGGKTEYAVAVYSPVVRSISMSGNGFNATTVTVLHGITPVVWINTGSNVVVLELQGFGRTSIGPSQNYTAIIASKGTLTFDIFNTGFTGTIYSS
jgi:hypothetical protein